MYQCVGNTCQLGDGSYIRKILMVRYLFVILLLGLGIEASAADSLEVVDWFGHLIRMMNQEGCREQGHLQINKVTMQTLIELHDQLLASTKFPFYNAEYYKVLPFIVELRNRGANKEENEIETCFNSLYGVMLLRLQKKDITPDTVHAVKEISTFIGMLSDYYKKDKEEGLKFE